MAEPTQNDLTQNQPQTQRVDSADAILLQLWSPYCKGVSLLECPSSQAEKLRDEIRVLLETGQSTEQVVTQILSQHGELLRMQPNRTGREALAYWIPWATFILVALFVIAYWMKRVRKFRKIETSAAPVTSSTSSGETKRKVLQELEERMRS